MGCNLKVLLKGKKLPVTSMLRDQLEAYRILQVDGKSHIAFVQQNVSGQPDFHQSRMDNTEMRRRNSLNVLRLISAEVPSLRGEYRVPIANARQVRR